MRTEPLPLDELNALCDQAGVLRPLPSMSHNKPYLIAKQHACEARLMPRANNRPKDRVVISFSNFLLKNQNAPSVIDAKTRAANDN